MWSDMAKVMQLVNGGTRIRIQAYDLEPLPRTEKWTVWVARKEGMADNRRNNSKRRDKHSSRRLVRMEACWRWDTAMGLKCLDWWSVGRRKPLPLKVELPLHLEEFWEPGGLSLLHLLPFWVPANGDWDSKCPFPVSPWALISSESSLLFLSWGQKLHYSR